MRVMVIVKANKDSEAGVLPDKKILTEMGKYNEELSKAGIMLAGEGLQPSSKGVRVKFSGGKPTVIDGPFAETKELVAGFWLWQVKSKEEAIEWLKRAPFDGGTEVEIRQIFEAEDFGAEFTPELRAQEERIRARAATSASCAKSSARPTSRTMRASPAMSRADSIRQTASIARWVSTATASCSRPLVRGCAPLASGAQE